MKPSPLEQRITDMIDPVVADRGLALVCVRLTGADGMATLQVMAENPETKRIGVDECATLSREIAAILDVEDPINGRYRLEVSSPGIDRPLMKPQDFVEYEGLEARVEIMPPLEGQKRFRGYLRGLEKDTVRLETDTGMAFLPLSSIQKARLILTDELLQKTRKQSDAESNIRIENASDSGDEPDILDRETDEQE